MYRLISFWWKNSQFNKIVEGKEVTLQMGQIDPDVDLDYYDYGSTEIHGNFQRKHTNIYIQNQLWDTIKAVLYDRPR